MLGPSSLSVSHTARTAGAIGSHGWPRPSSEMPRLPQLCRHGYSPGRTPRTLCGPAVASARSTWLASAREPSVTSEDVSTMRRWQSRLGRSRAGEDDPRGCRSCFLRNPVRRRCWTWDGRAEVQRGQRKGWCERRERCRRSAVKFSRRPAQPSVLPKKRGTWAPSGTCSTTEQGCSRVPPACEQACGDRQQTAWIDS